MEELGAPIAYLALDEGTPVYAADGAEIGHVVHVLADEDADVFDGLIVSARPGPGGHRFVDAPQVAELHERGVVLTLDAASADALPEPSANPAALDVNPADAEESELTAKLRRAWDYLSGRY
ncbi:MAG TPA: PRC-barrel domain-containing protein [Solirubrobacteraceae bacterium]